MSRLRILIRMESADAYELKAQALNKDPRLKDAGIAALKFRGDKQYIADGDFSTEPPPPTNPEVGPNDPKPNSADGKLRVVVRMSNDDSYELKAQALNNDPRLKEAGISALKFVGDKQYISEGEFSSGVLSPKPESKSTVNDKVRVTLRVPRKDAYELVARHLNNDPALAKAGISGVELARGAGMIPVAKEMSAQPQKKKRSLVRYLVAAVIVGILGVTGAGAYFFSNSPTPTAAPLIPVVVEKATQTHTPEPTTETSVPSTATIVPTNTETQSPTATNTQLPTATILSCQPPSEAVVAAAFLACRYGPGGVYLPRTTLTGTNAEANGYFDVVDVLGKADTAYGTWIRVQTRWEEPVRCWVNSGPNYVDIPQGDVSCLESLYPEKAPLIQFDDERFPTNVEASRSGNNVDIQWQGYELPPGDLPLPEASRPYLTETWTCQDGEIVFSPQSWDEEFAFVRDEAGCDEASYGYVYMAHVDGYIGPVTIPWPP